MINLRRAVAMGLALSAGVGACLVATTLELPAPRPPLVSCSRMGYAERLDLGEIKQNAPSNVGGMGMYPYEIEHRSIPGAKPRTEIVHANIALWTPHGRLLGSNRGEFGGELAILDEDAPGGRPAILVDANIEDLFLMSYGILATTGSFHGVSDFGSILLVTFSSGGEPRVREIFKLPAGVWTSWVMEDGRLLVNTSEGSFAVESPTSVEQVRCRQRWWQVI